MICEQCGKEFEQNFGSNRFCCRKCANDYSRKFIRKAEYIPQYEERICKKCGKKFKVDIKKENKKKPKIYCSRSCANSHMVSESHRQKVSESMKKFYNTDEGKNLKEKLREENIQKYIDNPDLRKQIGIKTLQAKYNIENSEDLYVDFTCPVCGKHLHLTPFQANKRKYCSGHCRNMVNNMKINGNRSKAEKMLENMLKVKFPQLAFNINDRTILEGLELDFYFPSINLAIEWNGIFHYKNVGHNFELIKQKDAKKMQLCKDKNIELYIVKDLTSSTKFIKQQINKIENLLKNKYNL